MSKFDEQQHCEEFSPDVTDDELQEMNEQLLHLHLRKDELIEHLIYLTGEGHKITSIQDQETGYYSIEFEEVQNASAVPQEK